MTAILGTSTDGLPTLELATPKGQSRWVFRWTDEGPVPVELPESGKVPVWVDEAVKHWWSALKRIEMELAPRQDAVKELEAQGAAMVNIAGLAVLYDNPQLRKKIAALAVQLNRRASQHGTPADLARACMETSAKLHDLLRRTDPNRDRLQNAPTPETKAKLRPDHFDQLQRAADLTEEQMDAAKVIAFVLEQLTKRLSIKISDLEPEGRGKGGSGVTQPIEALFDDDIDYLKHEYIPWANRMHAIPWHVDRRRIGAYQASAAHAPNTRGGTWYTITRAQVFDGLLPAECDRHYRIPDGRSATVLRWTLDAFPPTHRMDLDRFFS